MLYIYIYTCIVERVSGRVSADEYSINYPILLCIALQVMQARAMCDASPCNVHVDRPCNVCRNEHCNIPAVYMYIMHTDRVILSNIWGLTVYDEDGPRVRGQCGIAHLLTETT